VDVPLSTTFFSLVKVDDDNEEEEEGGVLEKKNMARQLEAVLLPLTYNFTRCFIFGAMIF
jgi:hypothetical protein